VKILRVCLAETLVVFGVVLLAVGLWLRDGPPPALRTDHDGGARP
jgi:hypothetical protein